MTCRTMISALLLAVSCLAQVSLREFVNDLTGDVYDVALSPTGDRMALSWCHGVAPNYVCGVYLRSSNGGEPNLLFHEKELAQDLRWSPDGKRLAFTDQTGRNSTFLWFAPIEGGEPRQVAQICGGGYAWTPDSSGFIAAAAEKPEHSTEDCGLWTYSLEGKRLGKIAAKGFFPAVSPDGRSLAFQRDNSIIVRALSDPFHAAGPERRLATGESFFSGPVWIAGGKELLYATRGPNPLHRLSLGPEAKPQILDGIDDQTEILSLDQTGSGAIIAEVSHHDMAFWRMDLGARPPRFEKIRAIPRADPRYRVSPDGRQVVFVTNRGLWASNIDGSEPRLIAAHREFITNPRWSPDGNWIAFTGSPAESNADLRSRAYLVAAAGGRPRRLLPGVDDVEFQNWSRDGKWLYLSRGGHNPQTDEQPQLWKANLTSGLQVQVTKSGGYSGEESFNGEILYYVRSPYPKLRRVPTSGGPESSVLDTRLGAFGKFAVGKKSIYFVPDGPNYGEKRISRFDIATGTVAGLTATDFVPFSLQLSVDERYLYATSDPPERRAHVRLEGLP